MKKKRAIKLMMSMGFPRNAAVYAAKSRRHEDIVISMACQLLEYCTGVSATKWCRNTIDLDVRDIVGNAGLLGEHSGMYVPGQAKVEIGESTLICKDKN